MSPEFITSFFLQAIKTAIMLAGPMLAVGLTVGILVSMFQAATQINEMTLVFVPKMLGVALALWSFSRGCWASSPTSQANCLSTYQCI